ncbi:MAG TPA: hypothetical protein VN081_02935, partial [Dongiaceae bacterium]|nr:hypothetical protein [Dongiaceae bacterium]
GETYYEHGEVVEYPPTKVIFLDKSARPLAWLVKDLWDTLAPDVDSTEIPKRPDFKFLNIDRNQWKDSLDPNDTQAYDVNRIPAELIEGLRSIYNTQHDGSFDVENEMDNQVIMIVDEVRASGATLTIAQQIIRRAFPSSKVFGTYWMDGTVQVNGVTGNADLPVWYRDDSTNAKLTTGRGVGNRLTTGITHPSQYFLSTRLPEVDQRALRLREDFKTLTDSLVAREVPYIPYVQREDGEARSEKINGTSLKAAYMARRAIRAADAKE